MSTSEPAGSVGTAMCTGSECSQPRPRAAGTGRCRRGCRSTSAQKAAAPAPAPGRGPHGRRQTGPRARAALQPGGRLAAIGGAQRLKPQVHHAATALAQGGAQGVAQPAGSPGSPARRRRASAMAWCSRWPPPMVPITRSASTAIQAPGSLGAEPSVDFTLTSHAVAPLFSAAASKPTSVTSALSP